VVQDLEPHVVIEDIMLRHRLVGMHLLYRVSGFGFTLDLKYHVELGTETSKP
jgi:hypothetical protein